MNVKNSLSRVVIVPRNGYVNRLQAMVSAQVLARDLAVPLGIAWERQPAAPAEISDVFNLDFLRADVGESVDELLGGARISDVPVGITYISRDVVIVAGGMAGEQVLMPELRKQLDEDARQLVIVAGGKFWLHGDQTLTADQAAQFRAVRQNVYAKLKFHAGIEGPATALISRLPRRFLGLHLRYADRRQQAPSSHAIRNALASLRDDVDGNVYIAGDDPTKVMAWREWLDQRGWHTWVNEISQRAEIEARAPRALVDWRILGAARRLVFFAESSFGEEAAVASGNFDASVGLGTNQLRSSAITLGGHLRNLMTYPSRHWI